MCLFCDVCPPQQLNLKLCVCVCVVNNRVEFVLNGFKCSTLAQTYRQLMTCVTKVTLAQPANHLHLWPFNRVNTTPKELTVNLRVSR
ncbi:hypothetical protein INR49_022022 [Caranx melampygus]|nr:hypothetical protein INR49_022022 [Caranx melampygus]